MYQGRNLYLNREKRGIGKGVKGLARDGQRYKRRGRTVASASRVTINWIVHDSWGPKSDSTGHVTTHAVT